MCVEIIYLFGILKEMIYCVLRLELDVCVMVEKDYLLRFNPKWDMHKLRTKQNREWFASKACSQNSGCFSGSS